MQLDRNLEVSSSALLLNSMKKSTQTAKSVKLLKWVIEITELKSRIESKCGEIVLGKYQVNSIASKETKVQTH